MTGLHRTEMTAAARAAFSAKAFALQGCYGAVTDLSEAYQVSRNTVYAAGATAEAVLQEHFAKDETELRAVKVSVDEAQLRRTIVALRSGAANSIRAIETLIPTIYPGVSASFGKIQCICCVAENNAAEHNRREDQTGIENGALDEMFSQGDPVLAGVDLDSGYLFGLKLCDSRSGEDWAGFLREGKEQGLSLSVVVKDAAPGIASGVSQVFPEAQQRDDCFHALYEINKIRIRLERQGYGAITKEIEEEQKLDKIPKEDKDKWDEQRNVLEKAQQQCLKAMELHDSFASAALEARGAMELVELGTGQIQTAEDVKEKLLKASQRMQSLEDSGCRRVGKYLENRTPGLSLSTAEMEAKLDKLKETYPDEAIALACLVWQLVHTLKNNSYPWRRSEFTQLLLGSYAKLMQIAGNKTDTLLDRIEKLLEQRHRASSAIEGFNASLRPFLYVQKGVTQGFLELFRAYHNLKVRRWGRHRNTSASQVLTGKAVDDWLSLLGFPPSNTQH